MVKKQRAVSTRTPRVKKPQRQKLPHGRPKTLAEDETERVAVRLSQAEYDQWDEFAKKKGYMYLEQGSPGPIVRELMNAHVEGRTVFKADPPPPLGTGARKVNVRCSADEKQAWETFARNQGSYYRGQKGASGPILRMLMNTHIKGSLYVKPRQTPPSTTTPAPSDEATTSTAA